MNDATREVGGVLGVAIVGSVVSSGYSATVSHATARLSAETTTQASESARPA